MRFVMPTLCGCDIDASQVEKGQALGELGQAELERVAERAMSKCATSMSSCPLHPAVRRTARLFA